MLARLLLMVPIAILALRGGFGVHEERVHEERVLEEEVYPLDPRRKRSIETPTGVADAPLSTTTASLLLILPLTIHWALLILLYARLNIVTFWRLSLKDKVLHLLSNTLVTLPVRKTGKEDQVHKAREILWSLVLVGINLLATALVTSALVDTNIYNIYRSDLQQNGDWYNNLEYNTDEDLWCSRLSYIRNPNLEKKERNYLDNVLTDIRGWGGSLSSLTFADLLEHCQRSVRNKRSTEDLKRIFLESSPGFGRVPYIIPKFLLCFGLPSLLCHLAGSVLLLLQYKLVHPWRQLGKKREANFWGKLGGSKRGLDVEMSPWKSGGAVSYDERFCLIAIFVRILQERIQRLLLNMRSLVPKRGSCNKKTASKRPWR